jgi:DNA-binding GntR family transcriptional regulator
VLSGRFKEGEVIRQEEIGELYGVSRTPVREALIHLKNEGLLEATPNGGVRVTRQAHESTREFLNPMRHAVEVYALRECFDSLGPDDLAELDEIVAQMKPACEKRDLVALAEQDIAFHRAIVQRSGQPMLLAIWSLILGGIRTHFQSAYATFDDLLDIHREHAEIVDKLRGGDKEAAVDFYISRIGQQPNSARSAANGQTHDLERIDPQLSDSTGILRQFLR